jgi:fatty acid desaturase
MKDYWEKKKKSFKNRQPLILGFALLAILAYAFYWIIAQIWGKFQLLDPKISTAILAACTTVLVATLTVVLGKYYERKMDIEAHYRQKKTEIYDEFLHELLKPMIVW